MAQIGHPPLALQDVPYIAPYELDEVCHTEQGAKEFAQRHGLVARIGQLAPQGSCAMEKLNYNGVLVFKRIVNKGKLREVYECTVCRKRRSAMNGIRDGVFTRRSNLRPLQKNLRERFRVSTVQMLKLLYEWCVNSTCIAAAQRLSTPDHPLKRYTVQRFFNHINEVVLLALKNAPPLDPIEGGKVEIDETLLRGKRKANRGRMLYLDLNADMRGPNHGRAENGPWVFGIVAKDRLRGRNDVRAFMVERRDAATLRPFVLAHVPPNAVVHSDEWGAYADLSNWAGANNAPYDHNTVNHQYRFVARPAEGGADTNRIEGCWKHMKFSLLYLKTGVLDKYMPGNLAREWFRTLFVGEEALGRLLQFLQFYQPHLIVQ